MGDQWRAGRMMPGTSPRRSGSRTGPGRWLVALLAVLAFGLAILGGTLLYLAASSRDGSVGASVPALSGSQPPAPPTAEGRVPAVNPVEDTTAAPGTPVQDPRVEDALRALARDADRAGQLLMVGWNGDGEAARETIRDLRPGSLVQLAVQNTHLRAEATTINTAVLRIAGEEGVLTPLIAVDHEGGRVQRIDDVPNLGPNWDFGLGGPTDGQACERGLIHARQLREMGFSMNLAPVLDVNNNPSNPVIGPRSYGADPALVARLGSAYVRGLQGGGVAAVGKHFPGHGNTSVDSHLSMPILPQTIDELERIELVPFRRAIAPETDIAAIMSAHIAFPALDPSQTPATLSQPIMTGLLRERLGFQGLVLSDDMGVMKAIIDNYTPGEAAVRAVQAGVDVLIIAGPIERQRASRDALLEALRSGELSRDRLDDAVRHVLEVKARFGLLGGSAPAPTGCR